MTLQSCEKPVTFYNSKLNEFENLLNIEKNKFWNILEKYSSEYLNSARDSISLNSIVRKCREHDTLIKVASFVNKDGVIIETLPRVYSQFKGIKISKQPHVKYIAKYKERYIARKFMAVQGFETFSFINPIVENGNFLGTLNILIEPAKFINFLFNKMTFPLVTRKMVFQGDGEVLYSDLKQFQKSNIITHSNYSDKLAENLLKTIGRKKDGQLSFYYNYEERRIKIFWKQISMEKDKWVFVIINPI